VCCAFLAFHRKDSVEIQASLGAADYVSRRIKIANYRIIRASRRGSEKCAGEKYIDAGNIERSFGLTESGLPIRLPITQVGFANMTQTE
jgi:hypothetical protein